MKKLTFITHHSSLITHPSSLITHPSCSRFCKLFLLSFSVLILLTGITNQATSQIPAVVKEWAVYAGNTTDSSFKIPVIIEDGDAIVATVTLDSVSGPDILIVRYEGERPEGEIVWQTSWSGQGFGRDVPTGIFIFEHEIYICGISWSSASNYDFVTFKLNDQGTLVWDETYNGSASNYDVASGIVVSSDGVFVTGASNNTGTLLDFKTICYDKDNGSILWQNTYDFMNLMDIPFSLQLSGSELNVVGACQLTLQGWEYQGITYETTGNLIGQYSSSGSSTGFDRALAVCADSSGNVYITGAVSTATEGFNIKTVKVTPGGSLAWEAEYDEDDGDDVGYDVVVDIEQNVYVCGSVNNNAQGTVDDFFVIKYNSSGQSVWKAKLDVANEVDIAHAICIDSYGNIIVTGEGFRESPDIFTVGFDAESGDEIWRDFYGSSSSNDRATDIAADQSGNVYVTGNEEINQEIKTVTIRYRTDYYTEPMQSDSASFRYSIYTNEGQIIGNDGNLADSVDYYMPNHNPLLYFQNERINMVWSTSDLDSATQDTLFRVDMKFYQSSYNEKAISVGLNDVNPYLNYFLGHCPDGISTYSFPKLVYTDVYPGIDVMFSSNAAGMKMYFICNSSSDPSNIGLEFAGQDSLEIVNNWSLRINGLLGTYDFEKPKVYQLDSIGSVISLPWQLSWYKYNSKTGRLTNWGNYDQGKTIVIEVGKPSTVNPTTSIGNLEWSTYHGGISDDYGQQVVTESNGDFYSVGTTNSVHFPNVDGNSLQTSNRGQDLIINKFNYIGTTNLSRNVAWCTYFGGTDLDQAGGIAVSRVGDLYITGSTASFDFPVLTSDLGGNFNYLNLNQQSSGTNINMDAFILKLRNDGRLRHWCSYIGGNGWEDGWSVKVNGNEDIYIAGNTNSDGTSISPKFPLTTFTGGFNQSVYGGHGSQIHLGDGFLIKFSDADNVLWSTFFGGDEGERISDLALLDNDRIAIVGITESTVADNPSTGTPCVALNNGKFPDCDPGNGYYDASYNGGSTDGFFAIFNSSNQLEWSSYFGGSAADYIGANSISSTYSPSSKYFVTGHTGSQTTFPTTPHGSYNQVYAGGNTDVFIAEFDGYTRNWCTFFGGGSQDNAGSIAGDLYGRIFISGKTFSSSAVNTCSLTTNPTDFPICNSSGVLYSTNTFTGVGETFLAGFNSNHDLIWSSYFGGLEYSGLEQTKSLVTYQDRLYFAGYSTAPTATPVPQVEYATYYWQNGDKIGGVDCYIGFFDLDGLVGVEENEQLLRNSNIYLAPNPTDSKLNILLRLKKSSLNESSLTVKIISPTGIEVLSTPLVSTHEGNFTGTIDVSKIASGIYFVMVDIGDQIVSSKFIKHD